MPEQFLSYDILHVVSVVHMLHTPTVYIFKADLKVDTRWMSGTYVTVIIDRHESLKLHFLCVFKNTLSVA
jgi:hypothetical protein